MDVNDQICVIYRDLSIFLALFKCKLDMKRSQNGWGEHGWEEKSHLQNSIIKLKLKRLQIMRIIVFL